MKRREASPTNFEKAPFSLHPPSSKHPLLSNLSSYFHLKYRIPLGLALVQRKEKREWWGEKRTSFRNGRMYRSIRKSKDSVRVCIYIYMYIYISGRIYEKMYEVGRVQRSKIRFFSTLIIAVYDTYDNGARNRNAIQFIHSRGTVFLWIPEKGETRVT